MSLSFTHFPAHPFSLPTMLSLSSSNPLIRPSMLFYPVPPFPPRSPHTNHYLPPPLPPLTFPPRFPCRTVENLSFSPSSMAMLLLPSLLPLLLFLLLGVVSPHAPVVVLPLWPPLPLPIKKGKGQLPDETKYEKRETKHET